MTERAATSSVVLTTLGGLLLALALLLLLGYLVRFTQTPFSTPVRFVDTGAFSPASPASLPVTAVKGQTTQLLFAGDIMQHAQQAQDDFAACYAPIAPLLAGADLAVANLEFPVVPDRPLGAAGNTVRFNGSPAHLDAIKGAGFDLLSVANNHMFDQGLSGVEATLRALQQRGLTAVGSAIPPRPVAPVLRTVNGIPMAFSGYTFRPNVYVGEDGQIDYWQRDWPVNELNFADWSGAYRAKGLARFRADVAKARAAGAQFVVALVHWGKEWHFQPTADQQRAAHDMIDAGYDLVVGGHGHVINGPELYRGHLIAYSQGNLLSAFADRRIRLGAVLAVSVARGGEADRPVVVDFHYYATLIAPDGHRILPLTAQRTADQDTAWMLARRILGPALQPVPVGQ